MEAKVINQIQFGGFYDFDQTSIKWGKDCMDIKDVGMSKSTARENGVELDEKDLTASQKKTVASAPPQNGFHISVFLK